jgi:hypothetical protein
MNLGSIYLYRKDKEFSNFRECVLKDLLVTLLLGLMACPLIIHEQKMQT